MSIIDTINNNNKTYKETMAHYASCKEKLEKYIDNSADLELKAVYIDFIDSQDLIGYMFHDFMKVEKTINSN